VAILKTDSGRQLTELADGPHRHERARDWQGGLVRKGVEESHFAWFEDYKRWLKDKEAHAGHRAFLKQALESVTTPSVGER
jgi:hypothetical protein